jgi:uncharacterized membrane protein YphA (DoxX/SURF4 family)
MGFPVPLRDFPTRLATGVYILHSGWGKRNVDDETAAMLHGLAVGAYPFLKDMEPGRFVAALSKAEMAVGALLLLPIVPSRLAGLLLTGFAGGLVGMYLRNPALHQPGSIWPTEAGAAIFKDPWMLGIGVGMLVAKRPRR